MTAADARALRHGSPCDRSRKWSASAPPDSRCHLAPIRDAVYFVSGTQWSLRADSSTCSWNGWLPSVAPHGAERSETLDDLGGDGHDEVVCAMKCRWSVWGCRASKWLSRVISDAPDARVAAAIHMSFSPMFVRDPWGWLRSAAYTSV